MAANCWDFIGGLMIGGILNVIGGVATRGWKRKVGWKYELVVSRRDVLAGLLTGSASSLLGRFVPFASDPFRRSEIVKYRQFERISPEHIPLVELLLLSSRSQDH